MTGTPVTLQATLVGYDAPANAATLLLRVDDEEQDGFVLTIPEQGDSAQIEFRLNGRFVSRTEIFSILRARAASGAFSA